MFHMETPLEKNKYSKIVSKAFPGGIVRRGHPRHHSVSTKLSSGDAALIPTPSGRSLNYEQRLKSHRRIVKENQLMIERLQG